MAPYVPVLTVLTNRIKGTANCTHWQGVYQVPAVRC